MLSGGRLRTWSSSAEVTKRASPLSNRRYVTGHLLTYQIRCAPSRTAHFALALTTQREYPCRRCAFRRQNTPHTASSIMRSRDRRI